MCQGFVTSVHYTVLHSTSSPGAIKNVTAAVTITDVPLFTGPSKTSVFEGSYDGLSPGGFAGYASRAPSVSVSQSFSVSFLSADTSQTGNVNGNVIQRLGTVFVHNIEYQNYIPIPHTLASLCFQIVQAKIWESRILAGHACAVWEA